MEAVKYAKPLKINRKENLKNHKWYWIGRRTQDVILSLLALVVLSPVMLITAIAIMIDDPSAGPIFSQIRIEMLQLLLRLGTFQLSDIFYNTVGGVVGGLVYYGIVKAIKCL